MFKLDCAFANKQTLDTFFHLFEREMRVISCGAITAAKVEPQASHRLIGHIGAEGTDTTITIDGHAATENLKAAAAHRGPLLEVEWFQILYAAIQTFSLYRDGKVTYHVVLT